MILGVSGHRKLGGDFDKTNSVYLYVSKKVIELLDSLKPEVVITGMALGTDSLVAQICVEMKIPFIAAVPFNGQETMWRPVDQLVYNDLLKQAQKVVVVCDGTYAGWKMQERNKWIVNHSDEMLFVYKMGEKGGTKNCLDYAELINKPIHRISVV